MATLISNYQNQAKRIVIKIGSSLLVNEKTGLLNKKWLESLVEDIVKLINNGKSFVIVSSGAIALGRKRLGLNDKKLSLAEKQACAATGQAVLIRSYEDIFAPFKLTSAQALLTLQDTESRRGWINARDTLDTLLELGAIPIINENDTVATDEIRYGDNDRLAARVAQMIGADILVLLSDIDGLYEQDPNLNPNARFIPIIEAITPEIIAMGGEANHNRGIGSGGMATKIQAARIASAAGCATIITQGGRPHPLADLFLEKNSKQKASWFLPITDPLTARKQWIAGTLSPKGVITIDMGAVKALKLGNSLLAVGLIHIEGNFDKGDAVSIQTNAGEIIGVGLARHGAEAMQAIKGVKSDDIEAILGYDGGAIIIHRDNLVLYQE